MAAAIVSISEWLQAEFPSPDTLQDLTCRLVENNRSLRRFGTRAHVLEVDSRFRDEADTIATEMYSYALYMATVARYVSFFRDSTAVIEEVRQALDTLREKAYLHEQRADDLRRVHNELVDKLVPNDNNYHQEIVLAVMATTIMPLVPFLLRVVTSHDPAPEGDVPTESTPSGPGQSGNEEDLSSSVSYSPTPKPVQGATGSRPWYWSWWNSDQNEQVSQNASASPDSSAKEDDGNAKKLKSEPQNESRPKTWWPWTWFWNSEQDATVTQNASASPDSSTKERKEDEGDANKLKSKAQNESRPEKWSWIWFWNSDQDKTVSQNADSLTGKYQKDEGETNKSKSITQNGSEQSDSDNLTKQSQKKEDEIQDGTWETTWNYIYSNFLARESGMKSHDHDPQPQPTNAEDGLVLVQQAEETQPALQIGSGSTYSQHPEKTLSISPGTALNHSQYSQQAWWYIVPFIIVMLMFLVAKKPKLWSMAKAQFRQVFGRQSRSIDNFAVFQAGLVQIRDRLSDNANFWQQQVAAIDNVLAALDGHHGQNQMCISAELAVETARNWTHHEQYCMKYFDDMKVYLSTSGFNNVKVHSPTSGFN